MDKHAVTNIPILFISMILIIALGILSYYKAETKQWYLYVLIFAAVEAIAIIYLAFL
jgi:hypothetical protein